ncbi:DNA-methyltransferase [Salinimicrobium flavum]|uniref:Methyltransferase n=1 Tax=Salinimicrobium flavum TaxID=1737065 RepID=A0ABW5IVV4_9FLAO
MEFEKNKVYSGDCIEVMSKMPRESIACCITDPPYNYEFIGHKWSDSEVKRRTSRIKDSKTMVKNIPYGSGLAGGVRNKRWYEKNRNNDLEYMNWCQLWTDQLFEVCKAGAPVAIFNSNRSIAHVQIALENSGFYTRDMLVYRRNSGIPRGLNLEKKLEKMGHEDSKEWEGWHSAFRNEWEAIIIAQKPLKNNYWETLQETNVGVFKTVNEDGSFQSNILENYSKKDKSEKFDHCTVKPLGLIKKLVDTLCPLYEDNIILDPFAGSGTTLVAAQELGFNYVGIEIEESYIPIINNRLQASKTNKDLNPTLF